MRALAPLHPNAHTTRVGGPGLAHRHRVVRAWRRVDRVQAAQDTKTKHLSRQLSTWVDDDGMVVIRGRLTPEVGAVVQRALEAAADRLFREGASASKGDAMSEELTPAQRRADALALLAESALAADFDGGTAGDRYQVVLHVSTAGSGGSTAESGVGRDAPAAAPVIASASDAFDGALEIDHGGAYVSTETSQRLSCDASLVHMRHDADGAVLDVGRKTRTIPPSIRRALAARDTSCRFPGCSLAHATPTTYITGPTAVPRTSTTSCFSADATIAPCTRADSASFAGSMVR